jgi:hypothetical protein
VLLLGIAGVQAQPQAAGAGKAKVDRLVMGLIEKYRDYWRPWINGTADHMIQHDPAFEWLFEVDPTSGKYNPGWLRVRKWPRTAGRGTSSCARGCSSTTATASSPPKMWCTTMPYGATRNTRVVKIHPYASSQAGICQVERMEVINDHEIVMHCKVVCLDMQFYYSSAATFVIFSKAQWDKDGEMAYETKPAGTGPYMFKERQPDRYVLYERAPTPHWKHGIVDWKELQMTWTTEEPTRLAQFRGRRDAHHRTQQRSGRGSGAQGT